MTFPTGTSLCHLVSRSDTTVQLIYSEVAQPMTRNSQFTYALTVQVLPVKLIIPDRHVIVADST